MRKEYIRKRVEKRLRRIAEKENTTYNEIYKVFRSQFLFAKSKIEGYTKEELSSMSEEKLQELVFNFIYIGKIHSSPKLQEFGNNKNNSKDNGREIKETSSE